MKIGLVIDFLDPRRGGAEQWTWRFAQALLDAGREVHVAAAGFCREAVEAGLHCHRLPPTRTRVQRAEAAQELLRGLQLDVVHDMGLGWYCDVFQPHGGSRTASFEQNLLLAPPWLRPWRRRAARWLPRYRQFEQLVQHQYSDDGRVFLALSQMVARDMQRYQGVRPDSIRIVYNGVDLRRFHPQHQAVHRDRVRSELGLADDVPLFLIVAHNFELKGVPQLISAVGRLSRRGARLHVAVAGGKSVGRYRRQAREQGAAEAVTFLGSVNDPVPYYAAADAYVQPTFYDPCSLVVLEAMAMGLPVITSRFNGVSELLSPREGFVLQDPSDVDELADCLQQLLEPALRRQQGAAALALAQQHSLERNCREIMAIYDELADRRRLAA